MVALLSARAVIYEDAINEDEAMIKYKALAADNLPEDELRNSLSDVLTNRHRMNHNIEDLERAINHCEHAIKTSPDSFTLANNLASHLTLRFTRKGDPQDLKKAIDHLRTAVRNNHSGFTHIGSPP